MKRRDLVIVKVENFKHDAYIEYCGLSNWTYEELKRRIFGKLWTIKQPWLPTKPHPRSENSRKWICYHKNQLYWFFEEDLILIKENV